MATYSEYLQTFFTNLFYTILGVVAFIGLFLFALVHIPIYIYRWIVTKIIAPCFGGSSLGKAVTVPGQFMATEFIPERTSPKKINPPPRCAIVCSSYVPGVITLEETEEVITKSWITKKLGHENLQYPEFQQYIEQWMGFMFWKPDKHFSLSNHIFLHKIPDNCTVEDGEQIMRKMIEGLVYKRFPAGRSPWEIHLLQNYRNTQMMPDRSPLTVISFRLHHSLADGFSLVYAILEGICGKTLPSMQLVKPKELHRTFKGTVETVFKTCVYFPWRTIRDLGYFVDFSYRNGRADTPFHIPDSKKRWKHYYDRSKLIELERIKFIKKKLGVSFTTVLLSCLAAGAAHHFRKKGYKEAKRFPVFTVVPLPGHPKKLRNHVLGTVLELNASPNLNPLERLKDTENVFLEARHYSQLPKISYVYTRLASSVIAPLARYWMTNPCISAALSNFPGQGLEVTFRGRSGVSLDFCTGGQRGVTGVAYSVVSFNGRVRVAATVDRGTMNRAELRQLIIATEREIEILYDKALEFPDLGNDDKTKTRFEIV